MHQIPGLYVLETASKGRGVFTSIDLKKGDMIEVCQVIILPKVELPILHKTSLHDYYFLWGKDRDQCVIALGFGSLYNHSTNRNANFKIDMVDNTIDVYAIKDIKAGEEITFNYHEDPGDQPPLWFDVK
jgi:SET domain-containing protein